MTDTNTSGDAEDANEIRNGSKGILDVQAREIEAQAALKIAEIGRWYEPEKLFAYVTLIFYGKVLIWDKSLALGSTDAVTGEVANWAGAIMAFYFGKRGVENVARIVGNRFGGR